MSRSATRTDAWVWVDLENTPHVLFLEPFVRRLRDEGWDVRMTAKPQAQTLQLATGRGLEAQPVGGGDFAGIIEKLVGGVRRALALIAWLRRQRTRPLLLLSSSRSASLAAYFTRVPAIGLLDYEHTELRPFAFSTSIWLPDVLRAVRLPPRLARVARFYGGLKENLYLDNWRFDRAAERRSLGVADGDYLIVTRPPATTAHYANDRSIELWSSAVAAAMDWPRSRVLISPRNAVQQAELTGSVPVGRGARMLEGIVPGPGLIAAADLVIGGGGTMNREAAVLGVPVWSVFCGPTPHIDSELSAEGRLRWVRSQAELHDAIRLGQPRLGARRGPFPAGFAAIYEDVQAQLGGIASPEESCRPTFANPSL